MNFRPVILIVYFKFSLVNCRRSSCQTVNGDRGKCVSLYDCKPLLVLANKFRITPEEKYMLNIANFGCSKKKKTVCCVEQVEISPAPIPTQVCYTPEGKAGQCISLNSCPDLEKLLQPPVSDDKIRYVERSKCNGPEENSVCCGPVPDFTTPQRGICASRVTAFPPDPKSGCCGIDSKVGNNYDNLPTAVDQYPWLTLIEHRKGNVSKHLCGGALISGQYVLTAAHCVTGKALIIGPPTNVRLAEYDIMSDGPDCGPGEGGATECTEDCVLVPIKKMIPHPEYDPNSTQRRNDVGLIRLAEMVTYNKFIRPICLPVKDVTLKTRPFNLTAAGWGTENTTPSNSSVKAYVHLPYINQTDCQAFYRAPARNVTFWKGQFCAGGDENVDPCKGDSGGPLMYWYESFYIVAGIVSFGPIPCGWENIPSVFTNVYQYNDWIWNNIVA